MLVKVTTKANDNESSNCTAERQETPPEMTSFHTCSFLHKLVKQMQNVWSEVVTVQGKVFNHTRKTDVIRLKLKQMFLTCSSLAGPQRKSAPPVWRCRTPLAYRTLPKAVPTSGHAPSALWSRPSRSGYPGCWTWVVPIVWTMALGASLPLSREQWEILKHVTFNVHFSHFRLQFLV